jgi:hypothetical protein
MEKTLKDFAIRAFNEGSDNFGETVLGTVGELSYSKVCKYYSMTVHLSEPRGLSTSGIGFYPVYDDPYNNKLKVCSGHMLDWQIEITPEIREELNNALIEEY